jgi:HNH endonuclease
MLPGIVFSILSRLPSPNENGCRVWPGSVNSNGYGKATIRVNSGSQPACYITVYVHRVAYGWAHGFVPLELDHLCRVRACGESSHLEAVTHRENVARAPGWEGDRETCRAGHAWADVGWWTNGDGRKCKECHRARARESYSRKQERYGR